MTSEVSHPSCPISNYPTFQTVDTFLLLAREPACLPYLFLISSNIFPCFPETKFASFFQRSCGLVFLLTLLEFSLTEFLRAFFWCIFLLGLRKKDTGKKAGEKCSPKLSQKYPSRENAILATQIPPSEKSNDSYKFVSLCASSGRQYFKFDLSLSFLLISFFEILNKTFVK